MFSDNYVIMSYLDLSYDYKCSFGIKLEVTSVEVHPPTFPTQEFTVRRLEPYTTYEVRVRAATLHLQQTLWGDFTPKLYFNTSIAG